MRTANNTLPLALLSEVSAESDFYPRPNGCLHFFTTGDDVRRGPESGRVTNHGALTAEIEWEGAGREVVDQHDPSIIVVDDFPYDEGG